MEYYEQIYDKFERLDIEFIYNDIDAWQENPNFNQIYNKLWLVSKQEIDCGPIGTDVNKYPIIIKPIINLYGFSRGFKIIKNEEEYLSNQNDGFFWMPYLKGKNYTIDLILDNGKIVGVYALESKPSLYGSFKYHVYRPDYKLSDKNRLFIENILAGYSGPVNIEIINEIIIEAHLRLNGDIYNYDDNFFIELYKLINGQEYNLLVSKKKFYLFPYFVDNSFDINCLNKKKIEKILIDHNVKNIRWDEIDIEFQGHELKRLFMIKTNKLKTGTEIVNKIDNLLKKE